MILLGPLAYGQSAGIRGIVKDKVQDNNSWLASVSLFQLDSSLVQSTHTGKDGRFFLAGPIPVGKYYLLVTHIAYQPIRRDISISDSMLVNLGVIKIEPQSDSLEAVVVRPTGIRPRMVGDTVEYNTSHIQLPPNALVEQMLNRLPGLQIGPDGSITYNGQKIQKLLVDGEDIFGSDPTLVTRNFDASKVAKVQVLDRISDESKFTGIDDGNRIKTLNLVLKEDSKNGYFGKAEAGAGPEGVYDANGLLASFREREQFTALGFASNTGALGFSNNETGILALNDNIDALGASAGKGIPQFLASALHYANTWNGSTDHIIGNYQYSHLYTQPVTATYSIQALPDSSYGQGVFSHSNNRQDQNWGFGIYDWVPDSLIAFKFSIHARTTSAQNQYQDSSYATFNGTLVNNTQRNIRDEVSNRIMGSSVDFRVRAKHNPDKIFSASVSLASQNANTNGYLYSIDRFFQPNGELQSLDTTDQRKVIANQSLDLAVGLNYTDPLLKKVILGISYLFAYTGNHALQGTYNKGDGKYQGYVDSLSSHLQDQILSQSANLNVQGNGDHFRYTIGSGIQLYDYRQNDLQANSNLNYRYVNFTPRGFINFTPDQILHFDLAYNGSTQQPTITQLQPIVNNANPLNIILGNPNLHPGFNQNLSVNLSRFKVWMISLGFNLGMSTNNISTKTSIDSLGRQISQPVNVSGSRMAGTSFSINKRVLGFDLGLNAALAYTRSANFLNATLNLTDSYTEGAGFNMGCYVADKFSFQLRGQFNHFDTRSSVNLATPIRYWTQNHNGNLTLFFIRGFEIHTEAVYTWQQQTNAFSGSASVLLWDAGISRNLLANRVVLKFQGNNLLNSNSGINRSSSANVNTETSTNIIGRYWLVSLAYHFDHKRRRNIK